MFIYYDIMYRKYTLKDNKTQTKQNKKDTKWIRQRKRNLKFVQVHNVTW